MESLEFWNSVCVSDEKHLKPVSYGVRKFTAIDAHSQIMKATEIWGMFGDKWGVKDEQFSFHSTDKYNFVYYQALLFYKIDDNIRYIPIHSSMLLISEKGKPDDDFAKKLATDALTKGLSKLGFNADVFLGKFDGNKYTGNSDSPKNEKYCLECGMPLFKNKDPEEYFYYCWKKKDGCGATFNENRMPSDNSPATIIPRYLKMIELLVTKKRIKQEYQQQWIDAVNKIENAAQCTAFETKLLKVIK